MKKALLSALTIILSIPILAYDFEVDGIYYNITSIENKTVEVATSSDDATRTSYYEGDIIIPESVEYKNINFTVTGIGYAAFCYFKHENGMYRYGPNNKLTSVKLPSSITYIDYRSFSICLELKRMVLPENLTKVGYGAFSNCQKLNEVVMGNNVSELVEECFMECTSLESIVLPESIERIGNRVFSGCEKLSQVNIPSRVTSLSEHTFQKCSSLSSIELPTSIVSIGYGTFEDCTSLTEIYIPEEVTTIDRYAFKGCSELKEIVLPSTLTSISGTSFEGCNNLSIITSKIKRPFDIDETSFPNITYMFGKLIVPASTKNLYLQCSGWKNFSTIEESTQDDEKFYDLSLSCSQGGHIICEGTSLTDNTAKLSIEEGGSISIQIIPDEGFRISSLTINGNDATSEIEDGQYTVENVTANMVIAVLFEEIPISITIQHAENGAIKQYVKRGSSMKFAIIPSEGWRINTLAYNGWDVTAELTAENEFTTPEIYEDATLSVTFESTETAAHSASLSNVKAYTSNGQIIIIGAKRGERISIYNEQGMLVNQQTATGNEQRIKISSKGIHLVKVSGKTIKVSL